MLRLAVSAAIMMLVPVAAMAQAGRGSVPTTPAGPERIDYLTFAQGAVPLSIGGAGATLGADFERAVRSADGDPTAFTMVDGASGDADTEFLYQLPAPTTFDRFAVPNVRETPSPAATFTKLVDDYRSPTSAADRFLQLASRTLQTHKTRGLSTELTIAARRPVRWVKLRLVGGIDSGDKTPSQFILSVAADGSLRGVRSSNRGPFRLYTVGATPPGTVAGCPPPPPPALGCGSIVHGITFAFDSAEIRPESAGVLEELFGGLRADPSAKILIEGHTSNEGTDEYNQRLSERRAQAVVADLVRRGLAKDRLSGTGIGESRPIASNNDESGRSLNRRVEVKCQ